MTAAPRPRYQCLALVPALALAAALALSACGGSSPAPTSAPVPVSTLATQAPLATSPVQPTAASILAADGYTPATSYINISGSWDAYPYITGTAFGTNGTSAEEVIIFSSVADLDAAAAQEGEIDGGDSLLVSEIQADAASANGTVTLSGTVMKIDGLEVPVSAPAGSQS